jgi:nucleotide-binding universal stress UspA family protein
MKQVLVAIDFSKTSLNALQFGIMLANRSKADLQMVWVDNTTSEEVVFEDSSAEERTEKLDMLKDIQARYTKSLKGGKLDFKMRKGKVYIEVANQAKNISADVVISGTHGVSGFEEFWIGSNAYRIVTHAPCPVVTIRQGFQVKEIGKMVLPIDSTQETRQKIPVAAEIARMFGSEVHILSLYSTPLRSVHKRVDNYALQVRQYLDENKIKHVSETMVSDNITRSTLDYSENTGADMIVIMTEQETTTANLFLGPYAQQMINHSTIPVLSVRSKELVPITNRK